MQGRHLLIVGSLFALALSAPSSSGAQLSLSPSTPSGQSASPAYEGWYKNQDGSFSLSFGYYNRNDVEVLYAPIGPDNSISPGDLNQGQPAYFYPRRNWGVFAVKVPANFDVKAKVVWNVKIRGKSYAIPGSLNKDWQIDALEGEAGSDNTPPALSFTEGGPEARGPGGATFGPLTASVGKPITIDITAKDDGHSAGTVRGGVPVALAWFTHQGPVEVKFGTPTARLTPTGGKSSTTATFSKPGDYIVRVRATDSAMASAGHAQCCWTNAFVKVRVTP